MLKKLSIISVAWIFLISLASAASAQVPAQCIKRNGKLNCKNPHCAAYCQDDDDDFRGRAKHKSKGKHDRQRDVVYVQKPAYTPPVVVVQPQPLIELRPPVVHIQQQGVVVRDQRFVDGAPSPDFYEAEIHRIQQENVDLKETLEIERLRVEREYQNCRYWYRFNTSMCYRDDARIHSLERQIQSNKKSIEENKDLQRRALRAKGWR